MSSALVVLAAVAPHASWDSLSTANGRGAAVYDVSRARVTSLREHIYAQRDAASTTRELMYDAYFGLRAQGSNAWLGERPVEQAGYDGDTGIARVVQRHGALTATQYVLAPFTVDAAAIVLVVEVRNDGAAPATDAALFSIQNLHTGGGASGTQAESITWVNGAYEERGDGARLVLHRPIGAATRHAATPVNPYVVVSGGGRLSDVDSSGVVDDAVAGFEWDLAGLAPGETRTFGLVIAVDPAGSRAALDAALAPWDSLDAAAVLAAERADWAEFLARASEPADLSDDERAVYRRSLAVLRMAQSREPGGAAGQIVASLPPGVWNRTWVRDQAYSVLALVHAGLFPEARAALEFLLEGRAGDYAGYVGESYAISVCRYFGDGGEESDWNADGPNIELDGFGLTLGVLAEYVDASGDESLLSEHAPAIFDRTADVLVRSIESDTGLVRADSSIWETHWDNGGRKHFTYTQAAAVWGLRAAARLATIRGDAARSSAYLSASDALASAISARLVDVSGVLRGNLEEVDVWLDAAVIEAFNWDVLASDGPVALATLDALRATLFLGLTGHGYRRNDDGGEYDEREWIVIDLRIATAARRAGRPEDSDDLIAWVTAQARLNHDLIPENLHPLTADYAGEIPMTGFGAGAYILALWDRAASSPAPPPDAGPPSSPPDASPPSAASPSGCSCSIAPRRPSSAPFLLGTGSLFLLFWNQMKNRTSRAISRAASSGSHCAPRNEALREKTRGSSGFSIGFTLLLIGCLSPLWGCGIEALFSGGDYEPTQAPAVRIEFAAPAGTEIVEVWDANGRMVASVPVASGIVELGDSVDHTNLRLAARDGAGLVVGRGAIAEVTAGDAPAFVALDGAATAGAILVDARVAHDGLALGGTPPPVVAAILALAAGDDPALETFRARVAGLPPGALAALGAELTPEYAAADPGGAAAYADELAGAVALVGVPIVCDPAFVRVMFTVDLSGQALDGNGARQLIRQPPKEGRVFLGFAIDDSSPIGDASGQLPTRITPNDPAWAMVDDGTNGDEVAGDAIYTRVVALPRGMRIIYKYTDGSAGEPFTRTEEWPGNARILQIDDVVTRHADGRPDCLVIRRDSFGDEASNKNFTSLADALRQSGGALGWDVDLGGPAATPLGEGRVAGGLGLDGPRTQPPLTPQGVPEARENGVCATCPAPLVLALDDEIAPTLRGASFLSTTELEVRFSETMDFAAASDPSAYLIVDSSLRPLPVRAVAAVGDRVRLRVEGPDLADTYTLHVRCLPDASAAHNPLDCGGDAQLAVTVGPDVTPPRALLARAESRKALDPAAVLADPTRGEIVSLTFTEELDRASAEDAGRYRVRSTLGAPLTVRGAFLVSPTRVLVVTDAQQKGQRYTIDVIGVRDFSGNESLAIEPLPFDGFALYRMTFGVVAGHAFVTRDGSVRGIPRGERLYLTGTPLAVARDPLDGTDLSIGGRTDVTGVPELELVATGESHAGQPIHRLSILAPPGVYAWKAAHGVPGEWTDPPPTLEKVTKSLGTTNDPTGVNVDPVTLVARNGVSYAGATISLHGTDAPGPGVLYKRENPDEICEVRDRDVDCPTIVAGTWRDLDDFIAGGVLEDYDDGEPEVPPVRLIDDTAPPAPIYVQVRDSESLRVSFDEGIAAGATVQVSAASADGTPLAIVESQVRFPGPHEIVVRTEPQAPGAGYALTFTGLADLSGNTGAPLAIGWTSPSTFTPFTPFEDHDPPRLLSAIPESPTSLRVQFDEAIAPAAADPANFAITSRGAASPPSILGASLAGGGRAVLLTTTTQPLMGELTLHAAGIADVAAPPNVLAAASVDFVGFGDLDPPLLVSARAIGSTRVVLVFDEALDTATAIAPASYTIAGATITAVEYSGDPSRLSTAFDPADARLTHGVVLISTTPMAAGSMHAVSASVRDLSGNLGGGGGDVTVPTIAPTVDVVISYRISDTETVAGAVPPRALSPSRLAAEREGVFVVGIGGFPPEGSPLVGVEPQLLDDGSAGDLAAGDGIYSLTILDVPLGSVLEWKAFASYTVAWKMSHPADAAAAFADALPGPSAFSDGQEYPGNENGVLVLGDLDGDGRIRVHDLFGDETTYKKLTMTAPFVWAVEDLAYAP